MHPDDIVCWPNVERYYGDNPKLVKKYRGIRESGECPFCPGNITKESRELVAETDLWNIIKNQYPYQGSAFHLLVVPKRHVISLRDLYPEEWAQMAEVIAIVADKYPFLTKGYGLAVRVGEVGGVTLRHLHWHLIAPQVVETGPIAVNFEIG